MNKRRTEMEDLISNSLKINLNLVREESYLTREDVDLYKGIKKGLIKSKPQLSIINKQE